MLGEAESSHGVPSLGVRVTPLQTVEVTAGRGATHEPASCLVATPVCVYLCVAPAALSPRPT